MGCLGKALPGIEQTAAQPGAAAQVQIELGQVAPILAGSQQLLGLGVNADRTLQRFGSTRVLGLGQHGQIGRQLAQQGLKQCRVGLQRDPGKTGFLLQAGNRELGLIRITGQQQLWRAGRP